MIFWSSKEYETSTNLSLGLIKKQGLLNKLLFTARSVHILLGKSIHMFASFQHQAL